MSCRNCLIVIMPLLFAFGLVYRILVISKPKPQVFTLSAAAYTPYVQSATNLSHSYPTVATQILEKTSLSDLLKAESLYKIITQKQFIQNRQDNCIQPSQLDNESHFIHVSFGKQVTTTLAKFFNETIHVLIVELNTDKLSEIGMTLKVEQNKPDGDFFPHLYGSPKLPIKAVSSIIEIERKDSDTWVVQALSIVTTDF